MQKNTILTAFLALSLGAGYAFARPVLQDDESTPLQEAMQGLMSRKRAMRRLVKDPVANRDDLLEVLEEFRGHALTAFRLPPEAPEGSTEVEAPVWRIAFQRQILRLVDASLECELAVHQGDTDALAECTKRLGDINKAGHDRFKGK